MSHQIPVNCREDPGAVLAPIYGVYSNEKNPLSSITYARTHARAHVRTHARTHACTPARTHAQFDQSVKSLPAFPSTWPLFCIRCPVSAPPVHRFLPFAHADLSK